MKRLRLLSLILGITMVFCGTCYADWVEVPGQQEYVDTASVRTMQVDYSTVIKCRLKESRDNSDSNYLLTTTLIDIDNKKVCFPLSIHYKGGEERSRTSNDPHSSHSWHPYTDDDDIGILVTKLRELGLVN